jgi:hypothetical protein
MGGETYGASRKRAAVRLDQYARDMTMCRLPIILIGGVVLLPVLPALGQQDCYGAGDLDGDGEVQFADFALLAECLAGPDLGPPPECDPNVFTRADLDADGDADLRDLALFAPHFDARYFNYGPRRDNLEAEMLAMALSGKLRAPDAEYERILRDLQLIRAAYPQLETVIDDPDYAPNQLLVGLEGEPPAGYAAFNQYYLVVDEEIHSWWRVLTYCDNLNAEVLALEYAALPGIDWAEANFAIGIDDYITIQVLATTYRYHIDDGFWDCFDGCDCHREWVIDVDESGTVTLVSYNEWGMPWCDFGG